MVKVVESRCSGFEFPGILPFTAGKATWELFCATRRMRNIL